MDQVVVVVGRITLLEYTFASVSPFGAQSVCSVVAGMDQGCCCCWTDNICWKQSVNRNHCWDLGQKPMVSKQKATPNLWRLGSPRGQKSLLEAAGSMRNRFDFVGFSDRPCPCCVVGSQCNGTAVSQRQGRSHWRSRIGTMSLSQSAWSPTSIAPLHRTGIPMRCLLLEILIPPDHLAHTNLLPLLFVITTVGALHPSTTLSSCCFLLRHPNRP
jgi:hypothetical protein